MRKSRQRNRVHAWKTIKVGSIVYLTHSRLKGFPLEVSPNIFEKKSTQIGSNWDTKNPYRVEKILKLTIDWIREDSYLETQIPASCVKLYIIERNC